MSRPNVGRYKPSNTWYSPEVKRPGAARAEWVIAVAFIIGLAVMAFAEPILTLVEAALR